MKSFSFFRLCLVVSALLSGMASPCVAQDSSGFSFGGGGWIRDNIIGHSSAGSEVFNGKSVLSTGAEIALTDHASSRLLIRVALGMVTGNTLLNSPENIPGYALPGVDPFVSEADFTYALLESDRMKISLRGGLFPYTYNPDVKDLGLYLLRGPVHPGLIVSGVETLGYLPVGDLLERPMAQIAGLQLHHQFGDFQGDLMLSSETQYYPFFDLSPVYIASYQVHPSLRVGAGVNFYHMIPVDPKLDRYAYGSNKITFNGTKLMVNAAFDPKVLMGSKADKLGPEDLRLYGEWGLLGVESDSIYRSLYGSYSQRMPVMLGFNLPAFNYLDYFSVEVEWYGAEFADDMTHYNRDAYSPAPDGDYLSGGYHRDNWKWSVQTEKTLQKHVSFTLQVANDHYRPGIYQGIGDASPPLRYAITVTPKDWYVSTKLAYSF